MHLSTIHNSPYYSVATLATRQDDGTPGILSGGNHILHYIIAGLILVAATVSIFFIVRCIKKRKAKQAGAGAGGPA